MNGNSPGKVDCGGGESSVPSSNNTNGQQSWPRNEVRTRPNNYRGQRRIWIKRPGQVATTVTVAEDDLVDDLKSLILMKYPVSLGRNCDPADLIIKHVSRHKAVARKNTASQSNSSSKEKPEPPSTAESPSETILQPDQLVVDVYSQFFPNGMAMDDALIIEVGGPLADFPISPPGTLGMPNMMEMLASRDSKEAMKNNYISMPGPFRSQTSSSIMQNEDASSVRSASTSSSTSTRPSGSNNNGVLLLPRHFQLPTPFDNIQSKEDENDTGLSTKQSTQTEPSPVTPHPKEGNRNAAFDAAKKKAEEPKTSPAVVVTQPQPDSTPSRPAIEKVKSIKKSGSLSLREGVVPQINVLIVEDNVINQKILEAFMKRKHIRCEVAKNGKEAVEKWRRGGFHLVLMDIQLPVMSGIEAAKEIRRLEHRNFIGAFPAEEKNASKPPEMSHEDRLDPKLFKSPVIIVALTASSSSADKSEALAAGCNDFLTKPVSLIWLEQKTIEWGCMQALIDFEGWKNWVSRTDSSDSKRPQRSSSLSKSMRNRSRSRSSTRHSNRAKSRTRDTLGSTPSSPATTAPSHLSPLTPVNNNH